MESVKITILKNKSAKESLTAGDIVEFKKEPSNKYDANAIMVLLNGKSIGYIANGEDSALEGCSLATEIGPKNPVKGTVLSFQESNSFFDKYLAEVEIPEQAANQLEFFLVGGISTFPAKMDLLREIDKGSQVVLLRSDGENVIGYFDNHPVGKVKAEDDVVRRLRDFLEDSKEVKALAVEKSKGNLVCVLQIKNTPIIKVRENLDEMMEKILTKGLDDGASLIEKMEYMLSNGVTKDNIADVFASYAEYAPQEKARINKPRTLYIDSSGIVNDSIIYILEGRNLIYEGDKGVGKNVLTETIAWLFNRPLYEFSSNSQHSNNSLMGGETFKAPKADKEQEGSVVGFLKKSISKFFGKTDDKELEAISSFVKNAMGKDDKELVFQMSSILEAFTKGGVIVLDEFNTSQAHVMPLFNALLDERRRVEVTGLGKVEAHPNFVAIGTQNKGYQGTFDSNEATVDRFEPLIFPPLESISKLLEMKNPNIGYETIDICNKLYMGIKKGVENGTLGQDALSTRGFISASKAITRGMNVKRALINSVANRAGDLDDREAIKNMIDLQVGT